MQPEKAYVINISIKEKTHIYISYLVCPEFSSVSVERTVVVWLSQQRLDGEKDGADLSKIKKNKNVLKHSSYVQKIFIQSYFDIILRIS